MNRSDLFFDIPLTLRDELFSELNELSTNFIEGRWRSTGLNAGRFCEVVYTIIVGLSDQSYPQHTQKPKNFADACRALENISNIPNSFRFLIPRVLSCVYSIRNQRDIGHVSGELDPSFMDASFVLSSCKWVMAELIRFYHKLRTDQAQSVVDNLSQYVSPTVWSDDQVKRVLGIGISIDDKILLLLQAAGGQALRTQLFDWLDESSKSTFNRRLASLHSARLIEMKAYGSTIKLLPPGNARLVAMNSTYALAA